MAEMVDSLMRERKKDIMAKEKFAYRQGIHQSINQYLSIYLSIHQSIYQSIYLTIYISIYRSRRKARTRCVGGNVLFIVMQDIIAMLYYVQDVTSILPDKL